MNRRRIALVIGAAAVVFLSSFAGSCDSHKDAPTPDKSNIINGTHAKIIQQPDGFRNVSFSCFGTNGVYVTSAGGDDTLPSSVYVLANDPTCQS